MQAGWEESWAGKVGAVFFAVHMVLITLLMPVLKAAFDRDANQGLSYLRGRGLRERFNRTFDYAFAVAWKREARRVFRDETYDCRGKVSSLVYLVCLVATVAGVVGLTLLFGAFAFAAAEWLWRKF